MDKFILQRNKAVSQNECNRLITLYENSPNKFSKHKYMDPKEYKQYTGVSLNVRPVNYEWGKVLQACLEIYKKQHVYLAKKDALWRLEQYCNIQKYEPGQAFANEHCEQGLHEPYRVLGWMVYLNTIKEGGGTCWPQQNLTAKAIAGDLYIWTAAWTHSHYGIKTSKEIKYILTGWYAYGQFN